MNHSNLPIGAENDSRAPFNQVGDHSHLCSCCDLDVAEELAAKEYEDHTDEYDEYLEVVLDSFGRCRECYDMDTDERI